MRGLLNSRTNRSAGLHAARQCGLPSSVQIAPRSWTAVEMRANSAAIACAVAPLLRRRAREVEPLRNREGILFRTLEEIAATAALAVEAPGRVRGSRPS